MTHASAPAARRDLEPTHPCIRCGREGVPADAGLCDLCNPLELAQPSATQMHGIAAVGILAFIGILAILARVAIVGTGPFTAGAASVQATSGGMAVSFPVTNDGSNASATTCRIRPEDKPTGVEVDVLQTPNIAAGATIEVSYVTSRFGAEPIPLVATCGQQ